MLASVRVLVCVVLKPGHTRYYTKGHCLQARGCSAGEPLQGQDWGSMKLIRPLGHSPRQQFLLLIPRDSLQIRTKRDRVCLKVFLSPWSSSTFCFRKTDFISFHFFFFNDCKYNLSFMSQRLTPYINSWKSWDQTPLLVSVYTDFQGTFQLLLLRDSHPRTQGLEVGLKVFLSPWLISWRPV